MRRCSRCGETKPLDEFHVQRSDSEGRQKRCKACACEVARRWWLENRERARASNRAAQKANRAAANARVQRWNARHPDKLAAARRAYRETHREQVNAQGRVDCARRRGRGLGGRATAEQIAARVAYYGWRCWVCRAPWQELDHVKPLSKGGSNWPGNIRPICRRCNREKWNRWPLSA